MSHRWNCPTDWEARREGERAAEWGRSRSSNPYEDSYWNRDKACPEAAEEWDRGYRRAEMRAEEEREEEAARQRAIRRRAEEDETAYWLEQERQAYEADQAQAQEYYAMEDARELETLETSPAAGAGDPSAPIQESRPRATEALSAVDVSEDGRQP